jgi:hypothetical protein
MVRVPRPCGIQNNAIKAAGMSIFDISLPRRHNCKSLPLLSDARPPIAEYSFISNEIASHRVLALVGGWLTCPVWARDPNGLQVRPCIHCLPEGFR